MAARTARKKTTRKTPRKTATRKKTARKKAAPRKAARKTATRKKAAAKARPRSAWERLERELPATLKQFSGEVRKDLNEAEKAIVGAQRDARRRWARVVRDASHQLGKLEARGEKEWKKLTRQARKDAEVAMKRLHAVVGSAKPARKKASRRA